MGRIIRLAAPARSRIKLLLAALLPVLATVLIWTPQLSGNPEEVSPWFLAPLPVGAPIVALVVNWCWPAVTNPARAAWTALPQLATVVLLVWLDVWLDVRSGYLLKDSGEEAMSYGIGLTVAGIAGVILVVLVGCAGRLGARIGERDNPGRQRQDAG